MVRLEAVIISIYGAALGLVLGTLFGVALSRSLADQGISELVVPLPRMAVFLLVAAVIGVIAAVGPARRAARLQGPGRHRPVLTRSTAIGSLPRAALAAPHWDSPSGGSAWISGSIWVPPTPW